MKCGTCKHARRNAASETGLECTLAAVMSCKPYSTGRHYDPIDGFTPPAARPRIQLTCARKGCRKRLGTTSKKRHCSGECALLDMKPRPKGAN